MPSVEMLTIRKRWLLALWGFGLELYECALSSVAPRLCLIVEDGDDDFGPGVS